jgi:hypothetical protein
MKPFKLVLFFIASALAGCDMIYTHKALPESGSKVYAIPYYMQGEFYDIDWGFRIVTTSTTIKYYDGETLKKSYTLGSNLEIRKYKGHYYFNLMDYEAGKNRYFQMIVEDDPSADLITLYQIKIPENHADIGFKYLGENENSDPMYSWEPTESEFLLYGTDEDNWLFVTKMGSYQDYLDNQEAFKDILGSENDWLGGNTGIDDGIFDKTPSSTCLDGNCSDGIGFRQYDGGDKYWGCFKDGMRHYFGAYFWEEGGFYIGTWHENSYSDYKHGIEVYEDGRKVYHNNPRPSWGETGCVLGDCTDGYGVYIWSDGGMHIGNWKNSEPHLMGYKIWASGDFWFGMYNEGDRKTNRHGIYVWDDGSDAIYTDAHYFSSTGCLHGDCDDNFGTYRWDNGDIHTGFWENKDQMYFSAKFWDSGDFFYGMYKNGDRLRSGFYVYEDGTVDVRTDKVSFR